MFSFLKIICEDTAKKIKTAEVTEAHNPSTPSVKLTALMTAL
jgi:hypothetical protein